MYLPYIAEDCFEEPAKVAYALTLGGGGGRDIDESVKM